MLIVGAGHAGCEAALAAARMGMRTCLCTMNIDTIGHMSCNPAIGGLAKGHLVREIDALGGEMARVIDLSGIQFKMLNLSKGPAVWSLRAQADRALYRSAMRQAVEAQRGLTIKQANIVQIVAEGGRITGAVDNIGEFHAARAVIVTTGTFLNGLMHIGLRQISAGRAGEFPALGVSESLAALGLRLGRLKTGTPPRLDARSIDFSRTVAHYGDEPPTPFSYSTTGITNPQLPCYMTYTNAETHAIIRGGLDRSPLYSGQIKGIGPRYCPSIEDKVVRFSDRDRHQVFLEPEGLKTEEYYANGISTSLPYDVQIKLVRSIVGLEDAEIMRPAYAIEYDFVFPTQILHSLETKPVRGLYLAGQINGTSGYEEAAAQGLMAGINAALSLQGRPPLILGRDEAYIGILIDDLVTKGTNEPYRMFTSRAEYRLLLRHDNADMRLRDKGHEVGLISDETHREFQDKRHAVRQEVSRLSVTRAKPRDANAVLTERGTTPISEDAILEILLKRPEMDYPSIARISPPAIELSTDQKMAIETEVKYAGYIARQFQAASKLRKADGMTINDDFDYAGLTGLSTEVRLKLEDVRPRSIGHAGRIPGVTPAALSLLMVALERDRRRDA